MLWVIVILMVGNSGAMAFSGYFLSRRARWSYYLALVVLGINILLSVTDQVGAFDWITLIIDLIFISILLVLRCKNSL
jgi:threonine/homoserine efflux transporter RhtA